jgi:hypothetical protein
MREWLPHFLRVRRSQPHWSTAVPAEDLRINRVSHRPSMKSKLVSVIGEPGCNRVCMSMTGSHEICLPPFVIDTGLSLRPSPYASVSITVTVLRLNLHIPAVWAPGLRLAPRNRVLYSTWFINRTQPGMLCKMRGAVI